MPIAAASRANEFNGKQQIAISPPTQPHIYIYWYINTHSVLGGGGGKSNLDLGQGQEIYKITNKKKRKKKT